MKASSLEQEESLYVRPYRPKFITFRTDGILFHNFDHSRELYNDRRRHSSDSLDMYILSLGRPSQGLADCVTCQTASKCTYFHMQDTPRDWQTASLVRQPRHVHAFTCKTLPGTGKLRHLSDSLDMYILSRARHSQGLVRRCHSSDSLDMYILSRARHSQGLADCVTCQTASTCTYFHVQDTLRDG